MKHKTLHRYMYENLLPDEYREFCKLPTAILIYGEKAGGLRVGI